MLNKKLGRRLELPLTRIARSVPVAPNTLTIAGFVLTLCACAVLAFSLRVGGILILLTSFLDMLDGAVARARGMETPFGAFLDSVLDRYADAGMLLAVAWNMFMQENAVGMSLSLLMLVGASLVSYTRARAEGLGVSCTQGLMERPERILFLAAGAITGYMVSLLWIMTVLTHATAIQRVLHTRQQLLRKED
jgi:phosphatidylglycerophosphate synthase